MYGRLPAEETYKMTLMIPVRILDCGVYHPWRYRGEHNPNRDNLTRRMMDFKDSRNAGFEQAVTEFTRLVKSTIDTITVRRGQLMVPLVNMSFTIAIVPSSRAGVHSEGLIRVATALANIYPNATLNPSLYRVTTVPSAHRENGDRSIHTHMQSIEVRGYDRVRESVVLILDDVTTTGGSLSACYYLMKDAGADMVVPLSILATASY